MIILDSRDLQTRRIVHGEVHEHPRRKEGKHHSRCGRGSRAFVARYALVMIAEIEPNLLLEDRLH